MSLIMMTNEQFFNVSESIDCLYDKLLKIYDKESKIVKEIIKEPVKMYFKFKKEGPDFSNIIDFITTYIKIIMKKSTDKVITNLCYIKLMTLYNLSFYKDNQNPGRISDLYCETIRTIVNVLELFDICCCQENLGTYYHFLNYKYYLDLILDLDKCILYPTIYKLGATDIISVRHVPLFFCGITTDPVYVDEFLQRPLEFFIHDVNHSRRSYANMSKKEGELLKTNLDFKEIFQKQILSLISQNQSKDFDQKSGQIFAIKQIIKMLIFEIVHEDALDMTPEVILEALNRSSDYTYTFEKMSKISDKLCVLPEKIVVEGALAYTRYKLQHKFYDDGSKKWLVIPKYRYSKYIAFAAMIIEYFILGYKKWDFDFDFSNKYRFYLKKASSSKNIPRPIHPFTIAGDTRNYDYSSLKTGLLLNDWSGGYRRVIGEHSGYTNYDVKLEEFNDKIGSSELFSSEEHDKDLDEFNDILFYFKNAVFKNVD